MKIVESRTLRRMVVRASAACALAGTLVTTSHAQSYTLTDGNAQLELHPSEAATTQLLSLDGSANLVGQTGYWYGAGDPVATHAVRTLVTQAAPNELTVGYDLLNGFASVNYRLEGGAAGSGDASIIETLTLTALWSAWVQPIFSYNDFNLSPADQAVIQADRSVAQYGDDLSLLVSGDVAPGHYEISNAPILLAKFNGGMPLTLTDTPVAGTPFPVPGDIAFALQWGLQVPPNTMRSITTTKRFAHTNPAIPEPGSGALLFTAVLASVGHLIQRRRSMRRSR